MGPSLATLLLLAVISCVCGQNVPSSGGSTNPMPGLSRYLEQLRLAAQLQAGRMASQSGNTSPSAQSQATPVSSMGPSGMMPSTSGGMSSTSGGMPSTNGGMPSNGGMPMGGMPSNGGMPMGGMPSNGGMPMGGMPSNGGMPVGGMSFQGMPTGNGMSMGMGTNSRMSMPGMSQMGSGGMSMGRMSMPAGSSGGSMASFLSSVRGGGTPGMGRPMTQNARLMVQMNLYERKRTLLKNVIKLYENHGCIDPVQKLPDGTISSMAMSAGCANSPIANFTCSRYAVNKLGATNVLAQSAMPALQQRMYVSRLQGLSPYNMFNDYLVGRRPRGQMNPAIFRMVNGPEGLGTGPAFSGERLDMIKNTRMRLLPYQCQDIGVGNLQMGICCPGPVSFDPQLEMLVLSDLVHT